MTLAMILRSAATALLLGWPLAVPALHTLEPAADTAAAVLLREAPPPAEWTPPAGSGPEDILRPFDPPPQPWSAGHRGVDLRSSDGTVRAPGPGIVRFVGIVVDRPVLTLAHPDGTLSSFEPIQTDLVAGDRVQVGDPLGTVDSAAAHCELTCVHWGVRIPDGWEVGETVRDRYIDPVLLLGWSGPSVLWPLEGTPRGRG